MNVVKPLHVLVAVLVEPQGAVLRQRYDALQKLRRECDSMYNEWLPHFRLVRPMLMHPLFLQTDDETRAYYEEQLEKMGKVVGEVCDRHEQHTLLMDHVATFRSGHTRNLILRSTYGSDIKHATKRDMTPANQLRKDSHPDSVRKFVDLKFDLGQTLGPVTAAISDLQTLAESHYKPHINFGQAFTPDDTWHFCTKARELLALGDEPAGITCTIDTVHLMTKPLKEPEPFKTWKEYRLRKPTQWHRRIIPPTFFS